MSWFWKKNVLFVCIYGLNSHLKCSFKDILEKNFSRKFFSAEPFVCMSHMECFSKFPYYKKHVLPWKLPDCAPVALIITFHPNFHSTNIWVFANLPIYSKLIHDGIRRIFCLALFWRRYKIVRLFVGKCYFEEVYIYIYWHYILC